MIKKLGLCFLIFASLLAFNPLLARDRGRHDSGRHHWNRHDSGRHWNNNWGRNWGRHWDRNWGNNWWWYNQGYYDDYPGYYTTDYYYPTTTYVYGNYIGSFSVTSGEVKNGVFTLSVNNGMAFQMSYPGYNPVGSQVDVYSRGDSSFILVINGQSYSATRVK